MKKTGKKLLVTASLVSTAVTMGGCRFLPWANFGAGVYGPPPDEYVTATPVPETSDDESIGFEDAYEIEEDAMDTPEIFEDEFTVEINSNACVYGPPADMEVTPTPVSEETSEKQENAPTETE